MIREYHKSRGEPHRTICLIPESAHGTNPASAIIAGMKVVGVTCRENGDIDVDYLRKMAEQHKDNLACMMLTYPSTHGVFRGRRARRLQDRPRVRRSGVHGRREHERAGRPDEPRGEIGADVCHLNLHKTFCIPHGGGGPGMGPICMKKHLGAFIPNVNSMSEMAVSAAPLRQRRRSSRSRTSTSRSWAARD